MSDLNRALAGGFGGASSGLEYLINMLRARGLDEESKRRFEAEQGFQREQFDFQRGEAESARQERGRAVIRDQRQRAIDQALEQINRRGGSYFGDPTELLETAVMPKAFAKDVSGAVGQFAPGIQGGMEAGLDAARGARQARSAEMAEAMTQARAQAQKTGRAQQAGAFPITVDPQEIFDPSAHSAAFARLSFMQDSEKLKRLDQVYRRVIDTLKGGASGAMLRDIFTNPQRKGEIEQRLMAQAKAIFVSQLQGLTALDPSFAAVSQDPSWVEGQIPNIVQNAILEAGGERGPVSPPSGGSTGAGGLELPPAAPADASTSVSKDAQRLMEIRRRMVR